MSVICQDRYLSKTNKSNETSDSCIEGRRDHAVKFFLFRNSAKKFGQVDAWNSRLNSERTVSNIGVTKRRSPQEWMLGVQASVEFVHGWLWRWKRIFCQSRSNQEETSCLVLGSSLLMSIDFWLDGKGKWSNKCYFKQKRRSSHAKGDQVLQRWMRNNKYN